MIPVSVELNIGTEPFFFFSGRCVGVSDQLLLFAQERERNKLLYSAANKSHDAPPAKKSKKKGQNKEQEGQGGRGDAETARVDQNSGEASGESKEEDMTEQMQPEPPIMQPAPDDGEYGQYLHTSTKSGGPVLGSLWIPVSS